MSAEYCSLCPRVTQRGVQDPELQDSFSKLFVLKALKSSMLSAEVSN